MSSLKFSYWSSPHISTKSGLNASSAARVFSIQPTSAARWRRGRRDALVVAPFGAHRLGPAVRRPQRRRAGPGSAACASGSSPCGRRDRSAAGSAIFPVPKSQPSSPPGFASSLQARVSFGGPTVPAIAIDHRPQAKVFAQRPAFILGAEQAAALQFGHDHLDKVLASARQGRRRDVEAVACRALRTIPAWRRRCRRACRSWRSR